MIKAKRHYITTILAVVGCGALALTSCDKQKQGSDVPAGDAPAADAGAAADASAGSDEPDATSGAVDHEAMTHTDGADGGSPPPAEG